MSKGLTIIEIIITIAILGIIALGFFSVFMGSYSTIYTMGNKSKAMVKAREIIDTAYENRDVDILKVRLISNESTPSDVYTFETGKTSKYMTEIKPIDGFNYTKLTVVVFYQQGKKHVKLTSLMPAGGI